jgi:tetratricopeptide (TPR) repeat protein
VGRGEGRQTVSSRGRPFPIPVPTTHHPPAWVTPSPARPLTSVCVCMRGYLCVWEWHRLLPSFAAAHSNLASILKEQGRFDQAIAHYQQALIADPKFSDAYRCS